MYYSYVVIIDFFLRFVLVLVLAFLWNHQLLLYFGLVRTSRREDCTAVSAAKNWYPFRPEVSSWQRRYCPRCLLRTMSAAARSGRIELAEDAALTVNLHICVVENTGLEVEETADPETGGGRIVRASKDIVPQPQHQQDGQMEHGSTPLLLLREQPALVCPQQDYMSFLEAFLDAPTEIQLGILDMFYQPLDSPMGLSLLEPTRLLFFLGVMDDVTVIHQLLCILMTNGHQYRGDMVALVLFGSKFSHSCHPNAAFSSTTDDGCLEYYSTFTIRKGDEVTFSYVSDLFETPTLERRQLLWQTKSFDCHCPRCLGPDYCRCLPCSSCCSLMVCNYNRDSDGGMNNGRRDRLEVWEPFWECVDCKTREDPIDMQRKERDIQQVLQGIEKDLMSRKTFDPSGGRRLSARKFQPICNPQSIRELVLDCMDELSSTHHLTVKALRLLVMSSMAQAYVSIKQNVVRHLPNRLDPRVASFMRMSVVAGIQLVLACECVAASCTGCYLSHNNNASSSKKVSSCFNGNVMSDLFFTVRHSPHYDRATALRHVIEDLMQLPLFLWPPMSIELILRYLPFLRIKFKTSLRYKAINKKQRRDVDDDSDTEEDLLDLLENLLQSIRCVECVTVWEGSVEAMIAAAEQ